MRRPSWTRTVRSPVVCGAAEPDAPGVAVTVPVLPVTGGLVATPVELGGGGEMGGARGGGARGGPPPPRGSPGPGGVWRPRGWGGGGGGGGGPPGGGWR